MEKENFTKKPTVFIYLLFVCIELAAFSFYNKHSSAMRAKNCILHSFIFKKQMARKNTKSYLQQNLTLLRWFLASCDAVYVLRLYNKTIHVLWIKLWHSTTTYNILWVFLKHMTFLKSLCIIDDDGHFVDEKHNFSKKKFCNILTYKIIHYFIYFESSMGLIISICRHY